MTSLKHQILESSTRQLLQEFLFSGMPLSVFTLILLMNEVQHLFELFIISIKRNKPQEFDDINAPLNKDLNVFIAPFLIQLNLIVDSDIEIVSVNTLLQDVNVFYSLLSVVQSNLSEQLYLIRDLGSPNQLLSILFYTILELLQLL